MTFKPPPVPDDARAQRTESLIAAKASDLGRWRDSANLASQWADRSKLAAALIGSGARRVLDVGAGDMALRGFLPADCDYTPADIVSRGPDCLVADLNQQQFPPGQYDCVTFLGLLEYLHDPSWALVMAARAAPALVVSYCADTSGDRAYRRGLGWVNDFTKAAFEEALAVAGWSPTACVEYKKSAANIQFVWRCARADDAGRAA